MDRSAASSLTLGAALAFAAAGCGQAKTPPAEAADTGPVFDISELDTAVSPCTDLDTFVNAKWVAANPIPPDRSQWGTFEALAERSLDDQHTIVTEAAAQADAAKPGSIEQKIGWFFRAGMDSTTIDAAGYGPIRPKLDAIAAIRSPADIVTWLNHSFAGGDQQLFSFGASADFKNAKMQIASTFQGGLTLPTAEYYSKAEYKDLRDQYVAHVAKLFELTGVAPADAKTKAAQVLDFETSLAAHSLVPVQLRDPANQYRFVSLNEANAITPHFDWGAFFAAQGVDVGAGFSLPQPDFFAQMDHMLAATPVEAWKDYLTYHVIADGAPYLSRPFQDEAFAFNGTILTGQPEQSPRWKRVLGTINGSMGQALGQLYVARYFPPESKARANELVENVRNALKARIQNLDWMSDETKVKALDKWEKFLPKIGYPDTWRDWSGLTVTPDSYYANVMAAASFNDEFTKSKIGMPTDRYEWGMTPQTVNAYYNPTDNTINFPAAILQPPFFYAKGDDAINYGGIGAVIGHEASHGFDDEGSQFDGNGNNTNWWTKTDRDEFNARTAKLVAQFNAYAPLPDHPDKHVNGQLTLGENIGDLGGLNVAYDALQAVLLANPEEAKQKIDGYTQDQRFFLNWARVWRGHAREKLQLLMLNANPHAPGRFRAIGAPSNMPTFAQAFGCMTGDAMVRSGNAQVKIW